MAAYEGRRLVRVAIYIRGPLYLIIYYLLTKNSKGFKPCIDMYNAREKKQVEFTSFSFNLQKGISG